MARYKDRRNYKPHNFNNFVLTINGTHKVEGLNSFACELDEDENTIEKAGDGIGIINEDPSLSGKLTFEILEASASNDVMWNLRENNTLFKISALDSNAPNLNCSATYCKIAKAPTVERDKDVKFVEWNIISVYVDSKGGSYAVQSA